MLDLYFREPGSQWAFEMAKLNLIQRYLLVGVTEELGDFVAMLESVLPRFFTGATDLYNTGRDMKQSVYMSFVE